MVHATKIRPNEPNKNSWVPYGDWKPTESDGWLTRLENGRYMVTIAPEHQRLFPFQCWKLMIVNTDQSAHHDWRDFQRIKNDLFGEEYEALELYPAESRKVDPSNAYILFVFKGQIPLGETERLVCNPQVTEPLAPQRAFAKGEPL